MRTVLGWPRVMNNFVVIFYIMQAMKIFSLRQVMKICNFKSNSYFLLGLSVVGTSLKLIFFPMSWYVIKILQIHYRAHHTDGVKSTSDHVSRLVFLSSCPKNPSINHLNFYCIKQIDNIFPCVCTSNRSQKTLITVCKEQQSSHSTSSCVILFCSLHAVTSSVIYYSTHTNRKMLSIC